MTKALMVNPKEVRKPRTIDLGEIPVNAYSKKLKDELKGRGALKPAEAVGIFRDMAVIREFESMLDAIKKLGAYEGIEYNHAGPAHLSIGQEASAVGQSFLLGLDDHIFGSHRSHGEILGKGLSSIAKLKAADLDSIMKDYWDGSVLKVVSENGATAEGFSVSGKGNGKAVFETDDEHELGVDFLLYGLLSEIFGRENGFNRGMGGSMHAFFLPFGCYPNNAIVGGSADIATGAALYKKCRQADGIVVANIGDASIGCGPVWEALNFSSMAQYDRLWDKGYQGGLPIIFNFMDNFYGMGGQPIGETHGFEVLARAGAAINPQNMHAEVIDGNNPLAVIDAYKRKMKLIEKGEGPVLLDVLVYRQSGHSPSDQSSYRERDEIEAWREADPLTEYAQQLIDAGVASENTLESIRAYATAKVTKALQLATNDDLSPRMVIGPHEGVSQLMFANEVDEKLPGIDKKKDVLMPLKDNPRVKQLAKKARFGKDADGIVVKESRAISFRDAQFEAIAHHFYNDKRLIAYGEENRDWGGAFAVYRGLTEALPHHRLFNSPISEAAIVGTAVGVAMEGGKALVELMYCDFLGRAGDEVFNQLSKWQAMSGGYIKMPVVLRVSVGSKYGAQHSQDWTALCAHIPGLKVVFPATPYDAKGLMASALSGNDPVVFFESQLLYGETEWFEEGGVPEEYYRIPIGEPKIIKEGTDLTILTFGATLYRALKAADRFEKEFGISVELIDGRSLVPFAYDTLFQSVRKTGKLILSSDACERGSYLHTVASQITQMAFDHLDAPPAVVGARDWIVPPHELEKAYYPQPEWFLDAYNDQFAPLAGYTPSIDRSATEMLKLSRYGVG